MNAMNGNTNQVTVVNSISEDFTEIDVIYDNNIIEGNVTMNPLFDIVIKEDRDNVKSVHSLLMDAIFVNEINSWRSIISSGRPSLEIFFAFL